MTVEKYQGHDPFEESILTVNDQGEEVLVPVSAIPELQRDPYHWGDAMKVEFDTKDEGEK